MMMMMTNMMNAIFLALGLFCRFLRPLENNPIQQGHLNYGAEESPSYDPQPTTAFQSLTFWNFAPLFTPPRTGDLFPNKVYASSVCALTLSLNGQLSGNVHGLGAILTQ